MATSWETLQNCECLLSFLRVHACVYIQVVVVRVVVVVVVVVAVVVAAIIAIPEIAADMYVLDMDANTLVYFTVNEPYVCFQYNIISEADIACKNRV